MSSKKLSKDSFFICKNESFNNNTNDLLNPNAILRDNEEDLFSMLKQNTNNINKRNPLVKSHGKIKKEPNMILNVSEFQEKYDDNANKFVRNNNNKIKKEEDLKYIIREEKCQSFPSKCAGNLTSNYKNSKRSYSSQNVCKNEENENLILENLILKNNNKKIINSENSAVNVSNKSSIKNEIVKDSTRKNNIYNNNKNDNLNLETWDLKNKDFKTIMKPFIESSKKITNKDAIKEEINELLNLREIEKQKTNKRRQSISIRLRGQSEKKRSKELSSITIGNLLKKDIKNSSQENYKKYIKYIDILMAITVCFNIAISIIDNEIYISKSDAYLKEYTAINNITSNNF